jgi:hypothetical protein
MKTLVARRKGKMRRMKTPLTAEGGCGGAGGSGLPDAAIATGTGEDRGGGRRTGAAAARLRGEGSPSLSLSLLPFYPFSPTARVDLNSDHYRSSRNNMKSFQNTRTFDFLQKIQAHLAFF